MKNSNISTKHNLSFYRIMALTMAFSLFFVLSSCYNSNKKTSKTVPMASTASQVSTVTKVIIKNKSYMPQSLTVAKGDTVTWINNDPIDHTVTSGTPGNPSGLFDSGKIGPNQTFSFVFDSTGNFAYYCKVDPKEMTGMITVK